MKLILPGTSVPGSRLFRPCGLNSVQSNPSGRLEACWAMPVCWQGTPNVCRAEIGRAQDVLMDLRPAISSNVPLHFGHWMWPGTWPRGTDSDGNLRRSSVFRSAAAARKRSAYCPWCSTLEHCEPHPAASRLDAYGRPAPRCVRCVSNERVVEGVSLRREV